MNKLEKKRREINDRFDTFRILQDYRNMDFPMNTLSICKNNLSFLIDYYKYTMTKPNYNICLDTIVQTHITNYLNSVKGYINRKKKSIELAGDCIYKKDLLKIIEHYWHKGRTQTYIDKTVDLRNKFEHEKIEGIYLVRIFNNDTTQLSLKYSDINLFELFTDCYLELEKMHYEIEEFIESKLKNINLRECVLFKEAFNRKFNKNENYGLEPPATTEEVLKYDLIIEELLKND